MGLLKAVASDSRRLVRVSGHARAGERMPERTREYVKTFAYEIGIIT